MKNMYAAQLSNALKEIKLNQIETTNAFKIIENIVSCEKVVEEIQNMAKKAVDGLENKSNIDLQTKIDEVLKPYLDKEFKIGKINKETFEQILSQDIKAEQIAIIYKFMYE